MGESDDHCATQIENTCKERPPGKGRQQTLLLFIQHKLYTDASTSNH